MKKLLIVGAGEMQVPVIQRAKELGYFCIVTDFDPNAPGFSYADVVSTISTTDYESTLKLAEEHGIDGILTTSDYPVRTIAFVCEKLGLKGPGMHAANTCTDKFAQRKIMSEIGMYVPQNMMISSLGEIEAVHDTLMFPLIVKPVDSSASRGVTRANNYNELIAAFNYALGYSKAGQVIVEQFIEGPEYSVESLTQNGITYVIAITEKYTSGSGKDHFVESQHVIPADITADNEASVHSYIKQLIKGLQIDNCATHAELKLSANGPVLIEVAARLGGDFITSDLVPLATGIDMLGNIIKTATGEKIDAIPQKKLFSGVKFINSENYKRAEELIATESPLIIKHQLKPYKKTEIKNSLDRLGYIIAVATERKELINTLNITE